MGDEERRATSGTGGAGADPYYNADTTDLVGQLLANRYRIIAKLGEGAMGTVYLGEHLRMGRADAIKVLRPSLAQDHEAIARFTRGTRNVSAIRHPNVCTIYDFGDTPEGVRYLAMEYIEGETLKAVLDREGRLAPQRAVNIACQVADALQAGHDVGVIHRDLKPGNIMLCRSTHPGITDAVKVVDFDISKGAADAGEEVTRIGFVVGTPEYMSPEQLIGERLDGRSDLYSLGVVLFRMLTGRLPFRAENTQDMLLERLTGTPIRLDEALPGVSSPTLPPLQRALDRALARKAEDRQTSVAEFGREIAAAVRDHAAARAATSTLPPPAPTLPVEAETPLTPTQVAVAVEPRHRTTPRRRTMMGLLAIAVTAVVALGAGLLLWHRHEESQSAVVVRDTPREPSDSSRIITGDTVATGPGGGTSAADSGVALRPKPDAATGRRRPTSSTGPTSGSSVARMSPAALAAMLDRQLEALSGAQSAAVLRAARDSAEMALRSTQVRRDSATAMLILAQVALATGDAPACAKWARLGAALDIAGFDPLLRACR